MDQGDIFNHFCEYVDNTIFSPERMGSVVAFVVDKTFIDTFCRRHNSTEQELMLRARIRFQSYGSRNILHVKGILAIQLYAASKRANSDGLTDKNYRQRLVNLLNWDVYDLDQWMKENQENFWESLYRWCDNNYFDIAKCSHKSGAGRYVQYPIQQAARVFTEEDLKYIAASFVSRNLQPDDDLTYNEFWTIVSWRDLHRFLGTSHARNIFSTYEFERDARNQIFNYFLRWDGEYKERFQNKTFKRTDENISFVYINDSLQAIELRDKHLNLSRSINLDKFTYNDYHKNFPVRRDGLLLFKRDDVYENYWQETRFLEKGEEGIAVVFYRKKQHSICSYKDLLIKQTGEVKIFRVEYRMNLYDLYAKEERPYHLEGGLKIGRYSYLYGGAPILRFDRKEMFWIDGKTRDLRKDMCVTFNDLDVGVHTLKVKGFKPIEIEIVRRRMERPIWQKHYHLWEIDFANSIWESTVIEVGISGLDLSILSTNNNENSPSEPLLRRWAKTNLGIQYQTNDNNIVIKTLANIKHHG